MSDLDVERGRAFLSRAFGDEALRERDVAMNAGGFGAESKKHSLEYVFGALWGRENWDPRYRSLVTIGMLIALQLPAELKNHVAVGLHHGLTVDDFDEILLHASAYVGFPAAAAAAVAVREVLVARGLIEVKSAV